MLNLKSASKNGTNVISYCLNNAINKVIAIIITEGIAAISPQTFFTRDVKSA
jgi:hypothetical protein